MLLIFIFFYSIPHAQYLELTVKDRETEQPIPYVSIFNEKKQEGTTSNAEGKVKLFISLDTLLVTHVAYENTKVVVHNHSAESAIYLKPKPILLEEVVIYNIDLK